MMPDAPATFQVSHFVNGLIPKLHKQVRGAMYPNLAMAIKAATKEEAKQELISEKDSGLRSLTTPKQGSNRKSTSKSGDKLSAGSHAKGRVGLRGLLKSPTACWTCRKEGHCCSECLQAGGAPKKDESSSKKVNMIQGGKLSPIKMKMGRLGPTV